MTDMIDPRLLLLSPLDNVVIARDSFAAGTVLRLNGDEVRLVTDVARGHKIACRVIAPGEKVLKYGAPIGSATQRSRWGSMSTSTISRATIPQPM